jgi:hypothetical protein
MSFVALAIGGSALLGAGASIYGANKQEDAANAASGVQQAQYAQTRADLDPWRQTGEMSLEELKFLMGLGPAPGAQQAPTREQFTTPGTAQSGLTGLSSLPIAGYSDRQGIARQPSGPGFLQRPSTFDQGGYDTALAQYNQQLSTAQPREGGGSLLKPFSLADFQESPAYQFNLEQGEKAINKGASARGMYYAPQTLQDLGRYSQGVASNEFQNAYSNYNTNMNNIWNRLYALSGTGQNAAAQTGAYGANMANQVGANMIGAGNAGAAGVVGAANAIGGGIGDAYNNYLLSQVLAQNQRPNYGGSVPYNPSAGQYGGVI